MNIIVIAVLIGVVLYLISAYNKGIALKNYAEEAFSVMDVYLKKRFDLVPNLVEVVKKYAEHEKHIFEEVASLRTKGYSSMSMEEKMDMDNMMRGAISKLIAVAENYPDVKANENFKTLMAQLEKLEEDISQSRKYYNGTVRELNTFTQVFPTNIICMLFGIQPKKFFEINEDERQNVKVQF